MLLQEFMQQSSERLPHKTALVFEGQRFSYAQLDQMANRLAWALRDVRVQRGDRVLTFLDNSPETVISMLGTLKADAAFIIVNPTTKGDKLAFLVNDCRPTALITDSQKLRDVQAACTGAHSVRTVLVVHGDQVAAEAPIPVRSFEEATSTGEPSPPPTRNIDMDPAALIYTSGSTGKPKAVMVSHRNMVSASTSITTYLENVEDDIILNVLPLSFDYGLYQVIMASQFGGTVVLERGFAFPGRLLKLVKEEEVTGFPGVPTVFALLQNLKDIDRHNLASVRYVTNTGAALPPSYFDGIRKLFPNSRLYSMYGLTECKRVSYMPPEELEDRPTSVGRGMPNEEVYVVRDDGTLAAAGEVGELVVRGSNVMMGYWERPEETAERLRPGKHPGERVLYTGDLFRTDEDGYLYFVGRQDDIIKCRGEKVSPKEVEDVLHAMPAIAEAAVIGVPDDMLGQAVKAVAAPRPGTQLTAKDVRRHCAAHLESYMLPTIIELRDSLPKSPNGKIDKKALAVEAAPVAPQARAGAGT